MSIFEHISSAMRCLSASKMRTFLTTLGIIVGISSVILINTLGGSLGKTIESSMYSMYSGNEAYLSLVPDEDNTNVEWDEFGNYYIPDDIIFPAEALETYDEVFGEQAKRIKTFHGPECKLDIPDDNIVKLSMLGCSQSYKDYQNIKITDGRFITEEDNQKISSVMVIADTASEEYFGKEDPIGKTISLLGQDGLTYDYTVVGLYQYEGSVAQQQAMMNSMMGYSEEKTYTTYIPYTNSIKSFNNDDYEERRYVDYSIKNVTDTDIYKQETLDFYAPYFEGTGWHVSIQLMTDQFDMFDSVIDVITKVIAAIAAVSLVVGGIGVMNIMLVSVTERTMEIGVRKALGADNKSIRIQFIVEAIMISMLGSLLGIVLGLIESKLLAMVSVSLLSSSVPDLVFDLSVPYTSIIGSVIFSFAVGIIFGVYPAEKAARMQVVDALRYE